MLTPVNFNKGTTKLEAAFDKEIPQAQVDLWYSKLIEKRIDDATFSAAIEILIESETYLPRLNKVLAACVTAAEQIARDSAKPFAHEIDRDRQCAICGGSGWVAYSRKTDLYACGTVAVSAPCTCSARQNFNVPSVMDSGVIDGIRQNMHSKRHDGMFDLAGHNPPKSSPVNVGAFARSLANVDYELF
ncbi:hypothetical protein [Chrysiogenes arsenatis]|uniref:hypothetical protein n=1 Tax=Chrysiogenes arsenatis TaxID=309797 RepID=UPI00040705D4|nr:hypothetical protein [Chrysiogenes arsenatis]